MEMREKGMTGIGVTETNGKREREEVKVFFPLNSLLNVHLRLGKNWRDMVGSGSFMVVVLF